MCRVLYNEVTLSERGNKMFGFIGGAFVGVLVYLKWDAIHPVVVSVLEYLVTLIK